MKIIKDFFIALKDLILEYLKSRIFPLTVLMLVLFFVLVNRLFYLQIQHGEEYSKTLSVSSEKTVAVNSIRGNIYDVNGKLLATNKITYSLSFGNDTDQTKTAQSLGITENVEKNRILDKTIKILKSNNDELDAVSKFNIEMKANGTYKFRVSGVQKTTFLKDVYAVSNDKELTKKEADSTAEDVVEYLRDLFEVGPEYDKEEAINIISCRYLLWLNRFQQYVPVEIAQNISEKSRASIDENKDQLLGMSITVESTRVYNDAKYFAHIIGYVGAASQDDINDFNNKQSKNTYTSDDVVGKTGVEKEYETQLHGTDGTETLYVDNLGKVLSEKSSTKSTAGDNIYLSIDSDLQKYCYDTLEKELAKILVSKIRNINYISSDDNDHLIPVSDVYAALFSNNTISLDHMQSSDASELEKNVYSSFSKNLTNSLTTIKSELTTQSTKLNDLPKSYQDYSEYICEMLHKNGIYDTTKVNQQSAAFLKYTEGNSSLQDFLHYLISVEAISTKSLQKNGKYYDSDDIYDLVSKYIIDELQEDSEFQSLVIANMVKNGDLTELNCINLLYDQKVISKDGDQDYADLLNGKLSGYDYIKNKITELEITPAMLNLTPCSGSIVVTDIKTGAVRALVSYPSYDNNKLTNSIDANYYSKLLADKTNPLYNRSCMMLTPPGSTFKIVSSVAGVSEGVLGLDESITDLGVFDKVYTKPECWIYREQHSTHGTITLPTAIDVSCNYFFYEVGYRLALQNNVYDDDLGLSRLKKYGKLFGLTEKSGIQLDEVSPHFSDNDAVTSAIGQGTHQFAPVQLSKYITSVANSGTTYNLTLLDKTTDYQGKNEKKYNAVISSHVTDNSALWNRIHMGMRLVVTDDLKNDKFLNGLSVHVAGKTGTAQVGEDNPANALFLSYAPYENPEVSMTTVIPNGYSSSNAAELSGYIYAYLYDKESLSNITFTEDKSGTETQVGD